MAARAQLTWNPARFNGQLRGVLQSRAQGAVNVIVGDTQRRISVPYPPASRPGEPPRRRTGTLLRSITGQVIVSAQAIVAVIIARAPYAQFLDPGTQQGRAAGGQFTGKRIRRRPFLGLPVDLAKMARIMVRGR